jgi:diadenosine tetraphosphate (Ap4A) HIT family hydrolase
MTDFAVDPVILSLTHHAADWPLSSVFVYDDARYGWGLLVPRRAGAVEMCDLAPEDQAQLMREIVRLSGAVRAMPMESGLGVEKLNVGNLGNMVPQLHVHVVGRRKGDPAWPGPVWGHSDPVRHEPAALAAKLALVSRF